jgi:tRNA-splicing endonuclease subunit Sen2
MDERAAARKLVPKVPVPEPTLQPISDVNVDITNQEHLQLTLEEAYFLNYALGSLNITNTSSSTDALVKSNLPPTSWDILDLFRRHSYFPPLPSSKDLQPDDPFLLSYITYHHFRSLGWVVRPGLKFAVDFLLYERGVVFSHAAFAVLILPTYSDPYWFATPERTAKVEKEKSRRNWHWFHAMNRVQNQVLKTLVVAYVDVPPPLTVEEEGKKDVGGLLGRYKIREFCVKRWSANRNRE